MRGREVMRWVCFCVIYLTFLTEAFATHVIHEIPSTGKVISDPGTYIFKHDIRWHPNGDYAAITIQSDHVTLNMNGFTLESSSPSNYKTIGILAQECTDLKIIQGKVKNMGLSGVECDQCVDLLIKDMTVDGIYYDDIINYTVPTGIYANECIHVLIEKCAVKNFNVKTGSSAAIQLTSTIASEVKHCNVSDMLNRDGACTGIGHLSCDQAIVKSCKVDNLQSQFIDNLNTEGHTTIGLVPTLTTNLVIDDCTISNITGCCDDAHGISVFLCVGAIVKNCKVYDVIDGIGRARQGAKATGIEIYASGVKVSECYVKNITAINPEDLQATGFSCALCDVVEFVHCKAKNVRVVDETGNENPSLGYGTGFGWAPDPRPEFLFPAVNVLHKHCVAENCQVGFDTFYHIDCVYDYIVSKHNDIPILVQPGGQRTLSGNPCSECGCTAIGCYPTPLTVTVTNIAANNTFHHVKE